MRTMTSDLKLTPEERAALRRWRAQYDTPRRLGYYAAILLPMVWFAIYGVIRRDVVAVSIAFAGILLYQLWGVSDYLSRAPLNRSLICKIAQRELGDA
jgi:hypothetical protein